MSERGRPRKAVVGRLVIVFVTCWLVMGAYGLVSVAHGDVAAGQWFRLILFIPVSPLWAAVTSGASPGIAAFFWCFGLAPWLLAALAIWRHDAPRWRWLCYAFFPLWWLGLALMGGTA